MGRGGGHGGGGGGHHTSSHSSSHHSSGSHSSSRSYSSSSSSRSYSSSSSSRSSSYGSSYSSRSSWNSGHSSWSTYNSRPSSHSYGSYSHSYYSDPAGMYNRRKEYQKHEVLSSCITLIASVIFWIVVVMIFVGTFSNFESDYDYEPDHYGWEYTGHQIDEDIVGQVCENYYTNELGQKDNAMLLYIAESNKLDDEYPYVWYGDAASRFVGDTLDDFWDLYYEYYDNDLGYQLKKTLSTYADLIKNKGDKVDVDNFISETSKVIDDKLGYIDDFDQAFEGMQKLYDKTGVQFYVVTVDYDRLPEVVKAEIEAKEKAEAEAAAKAEEEAAKKAEHDAKTKKRAKTAKTVVLTLLVVGGVVVGANAIVKKVKKKKEDAEKQYQKDLEIVNTPLEDLVQKAGGSTIDDLIEKYGNKADAKKTSDASDEAKSEENQVQQTH